jgi:hypothetical protein
MEYDESGKYLKFCLCGCGTELIKKKWWRSCDHPVYIRGHWLKRDNNPNWIGGRKYDSYGYVLILKPEHHFADNHGYVREHRLIYEQYYNCILLPWAVIDHINNVKDDNRIENLEVKTQSKHMSRHFIKDMSGRICRECKSDKTRVRKDGYINWYGNENQGFLCSKSYDKNTRLKNKGLLDNVTH